MNRLLITCRCGEECMDGITGADFIREGPKQAAKLASHDLSPISCQDQRTLPRGWARAAWPRATASSSEQLVAKLASRTVMLPISYEEQKALPVQFQLEKRPQIKK